MHSFDFAEIAELQHTGNWDKAAKLLAGAAKRLEQAGAEILVICTNTMHISADYIRKNVNIPLLHIADATAEQIKERGLKKVGLLGTKFTMEEDFYKGRLSDTHGIEVIIPDEHERQIIDRVIYDELCIGQVKRNSKEKFRRIMQNLAEDGAEGIILGCTEICLLLGQRDAEIPVFDTTKIHATLAGRYALS
jgi:aspartate racemase